jgi:hypothetical protein
MEIKTGVIQPDTTALAITLAEELTQDMICSLFPKIITALEKDRDNINKVAHPIKHEAMVLAIELVNSVLSLAACPVVTPPTV